MFLSSFNFSFNQFAGTTMRLHFSLVFTKAAEYGTGGADLCVP